jgi:hypothetical protein
MAELILALDVPRGGDALRLLDQLPTLRWVKLGPILMTREGPALVRELTGRGLQVFLDLKWHDIPNTVAGAVTAAREMGVSMATVHTLGGATMLEAAERALDAAGNVTSFIASVTVTSAPAVTVGAPIVTAPPTEWVSCNELMQRRETTCPRCDSASKPLVLLAGVWRTQSAGWHWLDERASVWRWYKDGTPEHTWYNTRRRHTALGGLPPTSRLSPTL